MVNRNYSSGTRSALMALCRGTCYKPGCPEPVVLIEDGEPVLRLDIAHICAESKGGPRFDEDLEDPDVFTNLLLLCKPHHKLIDQIKPDRYSVELLLSWKRGREGDGLAALEGIRGLTEEKFQEMLDDSFEAATAKLDDALRRLGEVDLASADLLRGLRDDLIESIPAVVIDPDLAHLVDSAGTKLESLWDTAPLIKEAADRLVGLGDAAELLRGAADRLNTVGEDAEALHAAADRLSGLADSSARLAWAAQQLANLPSETEELAAVVERWRQSRPDY